MSNNHSALDKADIYFVNNEARENAITRVFSRKTRSRNYARTMRSKHISRKKRIDAEVLHGTWAPRYRCDGKYNKGKIHDSHDPSRGMGREEKVKASWMNQQLFDFAAGNAW